MSETKNMTGIIPYNEEREKLGLMQITVEAIKKYICPKATNEEAGIFLQHCLRWRLDPFSREIYLIKYSENYPADIVVSYETYLKRAEETGLLAGWKFWTEGDPNSSDFKACIKIWRKDWEHPFEHEVYYDEYKQYGKDKAGNWVITQMWRTKKRTMIKKIVCGQGMRLALPTWLGHMPYMEEELGLQGSREPIVVEGEVVGEPPETKKARVSGKKHSSRPKSAPKKKKKAKPEPKQEPEPEPEPEPKPEPQSPPPEPEPDGEVVEAEVVDEEPKPGQQTLPQGSEEPPTDKPESPAGEDPPPQDDSSPITPDQEKALQEEEDIRLIVEKIKEDFSTRYGKTTWQEKYKKFKVFLEDFGGIKERKFVDRNQFGHLSLSMGKLEDLRTMSSEAGWPFTLKKFTDWCKTFDKEKKDIKDEVPF